VLVFFVGGSVCRGKDGVWKSLLGGGLVWLCWVGGFGGDGELLGWGVWGGVWGWLLLCSWVVWTVYVGVFVVFSWGCVVFVDVLGVWGGWA